MEIKTNLSIPQRLYERAYRVAQSQQRDVADVVTEALEKGLPPLEPHTINGQRQREIAAFQQLHASLLKNHLGEYVAIFGERVVDHDNDKVALLQRIDSKYPNDFVLIRQVRPTPEIIYENRSIRWVG